MGDHNGCRLQARNMLTRFPLILAFVIAAAPWAAASPFGDAANLLDGEWHGDGFVLKIDSSRAQASLDPSRPFEWQRFVVKEVTEDDVVFAVGNELFEASVEAESLKLSGTIFRGEKLLRRTPRGASPILDVRGPLP